MAGVSAALVVMAALFWGLSGGIGGILMADGWDPFVVSFYRGAIGLLCVLLWLVIQPRDSGLYKARLWFWSVIAGVGIAGNFAFYFVSIVQGSVAIAATLMYCAPVYVLLASFLLKLESATPSKWLAMALVMLGVLLLTGLVDLGASAVTPVAVGAGLLSGLCYAVFIFGFKNAAAFGSPQAILVIAFATLSSILIWPVEATEVVAVLDTSSWPLFVILGVLGAGLSFFIYVTGLKSTTPAVASIVAMVEPVTASLFGLVVLKEQLLAIQFLGMGLILVTVTMLAISQAKSRN